MEYISHNRWKAVLAPLFKCLEACFDLCVPLVISGMIDRGIGGNDSGYVLRMGGLLLCLAVIGLCCSFTAQYFSAVVAVHTGESFRNALFRHINRLSFTEIDRLGTSALITRMTSDINAVESGVNMTLRLFLRSPFIVFGSVVMAYHISPKASLVFFITVPLLVLVVYGIMLWTMPMYKGVQAQLDRILRSTRENLLGVRVVRAFNRQEFERESFRKENRSLTRLQEHVGGISALVNPVTYLIINFSVILLIDRGAILVNTGSLSRGAVIALINYMAQILVELLKLANLIVQITRAFASLFRIEQIFRIPEESEAPASVGAQRPEEEKEFPAAGEVSALRSNREKQEETIGVAEPEICFRQVSFSYAGGGRTLNNIDFTVKRGETIGVIGGTGSGKTTLISLLSGFYPATEGEIRLFGRPVSDYSNAALREKIGIVPQKAVLFSGTLRENLCFRKENASDEELWRALETAQAREFVEEKGDGLSLYIEQEGRNLSGGQRQRLCIARALVGEPELLILDDSASALDYATELRLRQALNRRKEGQTLVLVSQRVSTVRHADHILVLDEGRLAGIGTYEELYRSVPVYREICDSQTKREEETEGGTRT